MRWKDPRGPLLFVWWFSALTLPMVRIGSACCKMSQHCVHAIECLLCTAKRAIKVQQAGKLCNVMWMQSRPCMSSLRRFIACQPIILINRK
ncbi:hypothetical protein COO60DRAFT_454861 [Scenedesmus sp. NREL 46B-D3]|nr:hypothetical protein COO60DRAFT_454861 [Scenedesmus sp. NREL 46B-D3]